MRHCRNLKTTYQHTQFGTVIVAATAGSCLLLTALVPLTSRNAIPAAWVGPVVLAIVGLLFYSMKISIGDGWLRWSFGPGLIRKKVPLAEISSAEPARNSWSWGIHYTRGGWLYNVSGFDAVQFVLKNGKRFQLGTDEPQKLAGAVNAEIGGVLQ
jgi:hypothetical protein